jgi:hypothetical protein
MSGTCSTHWRDEIHTFHVENMKGREKDSLEDLGVEEDSSGFILLGRWSGCGILVKNHVL